MKPTRPSKPVPSRFAPSDTRWLLLIHQIPPKPDYLRVKIGRRLRRAGAVPIKNGMYVLPPTADAYEDFQWIVREIEEGGGDAFISEASLVGEGLTDEDVRARFSAARHEDYRAILAEAHALLKSLDARPSGGKPASKAKRPNGARAASTTAARELSAEHELAKLRRRYDAVSALDFFAADASPAVVEALGAIQRHIERERAQDHGTRSARAVDGATWVTRRDVHVDRIASAWLIRRFIDRRPRFRFVDPRRYAHVEGELRYDMFEAEYTHGGDACTFETLVSDFVPNDTALREIAEIVHDVDCKDAKFGRGEAAGLARLIAGIARRCEGDEDRLERGRMLFDDLYAALGGEGAS